MKKSNDFYNVKNTGIKDPNIIRLVSANYAQTECQFRYCGMAIPSPQMRFRTAALRSITAVRF